MSFLAYPFSQAKKPFAEVLPDQRKRLTRYFQVPTTAFIPPGLDDAPGTVDDWPDAPSGWTGLRLTYKKFEDELAQKGADTRPILQLIYEEIPENERVEVGEPTRAVTQYGFTEYTVRYVQFSNGASSYTDTVGTSTFSGAVLKTVEVPDDGTLKNYTLVYTTGGEMSDIEELRFGGKISIRTLRYLNEVPPTPSGYTLVGPGIEYVEGLPLYTYQFARASNGSGGGTGGQISQSFTNLQGGDIAFDLTNPDGATGEVICVTQYVTTPAITANPVTQPTSFVLFAVDVQDEAGYRLWTTKSGFGGGNSISVDVNGEPDGSLIYTVSQNDDDGTTVPAYPGSGTAYNVKTTHTRDNGFFKNTTIWQKPPATDTYTKTMGFEEPGIAEFTGTPPQFVMRPPKQRTLVVDVEVSYSTAQLSVTVFSVDAYASFYETYTPTDTGVAVQTQRGLGGYLAQASGTSGTNTVYNGVLCDEFEANLISSVPSVMPTGTTTLKVDNDPYLTDVAGLKVYRRSQVTYSF
jgi:hypothetical protein